jgi:hypothetical protein
MAVRALHVRLPALGFRLERNAPSPASAGSVQLLKHEPHALQPITARVALRCKLFHKTRR